MLNPFFSPKGLLLQEMVTDGVEVITGFVRDDQFGSMVLFGSGGTNVELYKDVDTAIAPLNEQRAANLMNRTKVIQKLKGWRNFPENDIECVKKTIVALGQIATDFPEIKELEINPLMVQKKGSGAVALDVRGFLNS